LSSAPAPMSVVPPASASASGSESGSASAVASATASAAASSAAVVAARASAPYEGLYFISADRNTTCALLGRWLSCLALDFPDGRRQPLLLAVSVDGTMLKPLRDGVAPPFTLGAPAGAGGRWGLRAPSRGALT